MKLILCIAWALLAPPLAVQAQTGGGAPPRTAHGRPDLQGVWDFRTITPLQRPAALGDKAVLTAEEAAQIEAQWAGIKFFDRPAREGEVIAYNDFWLDLGTSVVGSRRTSLIVDPPDGRLPPLAPNVPRQVASLNADLPGERPVRYRAGGIGADGPEDRGVGVRCILGFNSGPPIMPSAYNNMQLFQTPDHVVILTEMVHDARDRHGRDPAPDRTFHPSRCRDAVLRVHRRGPDRLHAPVHRCPPDVQELGADVRVRVSRGELRHDEHAEGARIQEQAADDAARPE